MFAKTREYNLRRPVRPHRRAGLREGGDGFAREDVKLANGVVHKAGSGHATFLLGNYDFGEGEIDFPTLTRILKRRQYKGWICLDHHYARVSPRYNYGRCMEYIKNTLGPIYS